MGSRGEVAPRESDEADSELTPGARKVSKVTRSFWVGHLWGQVLNFLERTELICAVTV